MKFGKRLQSGIYEPWKDYVGLLKLLFNFNVNTTF